MIFFDKTRTIGQDANGKNVVWVSVYVDTAANLPAYNDYQSDGFIMCMASEGRCIDTGDLYRLDSSGTWQITQAGTGTYTKAEIDALLNAKQGVLTFDATPTQNSTNPVTSGGIWTDQQRQETEIGAVANAGAKNLLKVSVPDAKANAGNTGFTWSGNKASKNHVSFEIKDDLTVYVKSDTGYTASDVTIFYLTDGSCAYPNTILNGCPSGGSSTTYELRTATPVKSDYGSGVEITSDSATNVVIIIRSGWSGELTFRPMIRPAAITDPTFQPYAKTNRDLTILTDEDRASLVEIVDGGAKNVLQFDYISGGTAQGGGTSWTSNGVEFSLADGEITVNRTSASSSDASCQLYLGNSKIFIDSLCDGEHVLSGCPSGGSVDNFFLMAARDSYTRKDTGDGILITDNGSTNNVYLQITVKSSYSPSNLKFRPMICTAAAWKISQTFQPYRPSWQEMYNMILALQ